MMHRNGNSNGNGNGRIAPRKPAGEVNIALVGLGYWGPNILRVLIEMSGVRVSYICDIDEDRLRHYARRYPSTIATLRYEDALEDADVDAVIIVTPVFTHYEIASAALAAGKHTLVEKPLAPSANESLDLRATAKENGLVLMCGHTFLYSPPVRAVKEIIQRQDLGEIYFVSASRVNLGLHQRDVSVIWDLGPHDFSILLYWLEEFPEWVSAEGRDSIECVRDPAQPAPFIDIATDVVRLIEQADQSIASDSRLMGAGMNGKRMRAPLAPRV